MSLKQISVNVKWKTEVHLIEKQLERKKREFKTFSNPKQQNSRMFFGVLQKNFKLSEQKRNSSSDFLYFFHYSSKKLH